MDPRFIRTTNGLGGTAQIEGASVVGGMPATPGSPGGTPTIVTNQPPAVSRVMIFWGLAVGVLVLFHVGGARIG